MFKKSRSQGRDFGRSRVFRKPRANKKYFSDISKFIKKADLVVEEKPYIPTNSFSDFAIDERLKKNVLRYGYNHPTPIQDESIPFILEGKDIVGIANTGTGKTASFVIPLLDKISRDKNQKVLILAPTRELAIQINQELTKLAYGLSIFSVCTVGGMPIYRQINDLRRSFNFVIGTPGRIKDLVERKVIELEQFQTIVLDEADRMLDMGFINDMKFLMKGMPKERHTLFFSATLSPDIKKIINEFLNNPVSVSVKTRDTSSNVDQDVIYVKNGPKLEILHNLLTKPDFNKVLIFGRTKHGVENLSNMLTKRGFKAESIHGDKNHSQRQRALSQFKENRSQILVATDVAARGLDIPNVSHVINYELPSTYEDYIHRIGRTGRAGKTGKALTFVE